MWDGIAEDLMQNGTYEIRYAAEAVNDLHGMRPFNRRQVWMGSSFIFHTGNRRENRDMDGKRLVGRCAAPSGRRRRDCPA